MLALFLVSLRDVKVLACSPQNTWVFNSLRVIPKKIFEHVSGFPLPGMGDVSGDLVEPITLVGSDYQLIVLGGFLNEASGFSSLIPIQVDTGARVVVDLDWSHNPSSQCASPSLDNFLIPKKFMGFGECGDADKSQDVFP